MSRKGRGVQIESVRLRQASSALVATRRSPGSVGVSACREPRTLLRRQVLEHQGILGRNEVAERNLVKRKLPEEREDPVVVDLRSARQANLFDFPAASLSDGVADLPDQPLLCLELEARWDGKGAYRAHWHVLDPAVLAHGFVHPFPDQDARIRNGPRLVNRFVHLLEDLLLGAII